MARPKYIGPDDREISKKEYEKIKDDLSKRVVLEFENEKIHVTLIWIGRVTNADEFRDYWKVFEVSVLNKRVDEWGRESTTIDPELSRAFGYKKEAIAHFNEVVAKWTDSYKSTTINEFGEEVEELVMVGNLAEPPEPEQPAMDRVSVASFRENDEAGSW